MKLSIITINYNNANGLEKTIQSVVSQTFADYEYIIIDGGSTDDSVDIIKKYKNYINFWVSEPDKGIYNAMNKGISLAHGEYYNFMNSGDCFHSSNVLEEIYQNIQDEDILIGKCCNAKTRVVLRTLKAGQNVSMMTLMKEMINHQSTFYKRSIFEKHKYDESLKIVSDWKINIQSIVLDNCKVKALDILVTDYDTTGISSTNNQLYAEEKKQVLNELIPKRIQIDYKRLYTDEELPIVTLLPNLKRNWRLQCFIYKLAKCILKMSKCISNYKCHFN